MSEHHVGLTSDGSVATVRFDRSARGNAMTAPALADLVAALERAADDEQVHVLVLEMAGAHFCAGWDTSTFADLAMASERQIADDLRDNDALLARIAALPVPVLTAVRGRVAGFGAGLLASVTVPIVSSEATLALPEARFGICPGGVLHTMLDRLPAPAVALLVHTGKVATATELTAWGLAARMVDPDELDDAVADLAAQIAANPPGTSRAVVAATRAVLDVGSPEPAYLAAARSLRSGSARA
ncbi:enoyl-CoA hydratase/isomerase family protein [Nocardioides sp. R-C-SC26]|uniref:enoyl-CoA hydratase/isomerase family protein n=1 Tax=Nocardioides sp. R-C-SC26 TaxID=2870414 RepID=UPI001E2CE8B4|nr:enoyl-CoA hydratase/isomerase family protein [Nocardioides sp. R-C-SC26]